jgi:pimeloyl-ACP methyl ester carboxylesterase
VLSALATSFHVVAHDQLGFGRTGRPADGRYGRAVWTRHALGLVDALGIERLHVVGNSMGGAIALSMAAERPEVVERLVLMGTTGVGFDLPPGLDQVWGYEPGFEAMRRLVQLFAFDDEAVATDELVRLRYETSLEPRTRESYEAMFPAPRQRWVDDLALTRAELEGIAAPVLLVHGAQDRVVPLRDSFLPLLEALPDVRGHVFGRCGHATPLERTDEFNALLTTFLETDR